MAFEIMVTAGAGVEIPDRRLDLVAVTRQLTPRHGKSCIDSLGAWVWGGLASY
jgi:hypothetical protein